MRDDRRNYLIVGVFVIAMVAGLVVWIALLTGQTGSTDPYEIRFKSVMGLTPGTEVLYQGYRLGQIDSIEPTSKDGGGFRLAVSLRSGWKIPEDSIAEITASGLLSAVVVDIRAGSSQRHLEVGERIPSVEPANLFAIMSTVATQVSEMMDGTLRPLLDDLAAQIPAIVGDLKTFSEGLDETLGGVQKILTDENTAHVSDILENFSDASQEVSTLSGDLQATRENVDALVSNLNEVVEANAPRVEDSMQDLHATLDSLSRHIDAINRNLESTLRNMNEFSDQLRRNPGILIRGRDEGSGTASAGAE